MAVNRNATRLIVAAALIFMLLGLTIAFLLPR
jgi:hypothetical protein